MQSESEKPRWRQHTTFISLVTNGPPTFDRWRKSRQIKLPCTKLQYKLVAYIGFPDSTPTEADIPHGSSLCSCPNSTPARAPAASTQPPETIPPSACPSSDHKQGREKTKTRTQKKFTSNPKSQIVSSVWRIIWKANPVQFSAYVVSNSKEVTKTLSK